MILTQHGINSLSGEFVEIGGHKYRTVTIGNQTWLAENLDCDIPGFNYKTSSNYPAYGRYYLARNIYSNSQNLITICPSGWRFPTNEDISLLISAAGGTGYNARKLISTEDGGTDILGLSLRLGGIFDDSSYPTNVSIAYITGPMATYGPSFLRANNDSGYLNFWSRYGYNADNSYFPIRLVKDAV